MISSNNVYFSAIAITSYAILFSYMIQISSFASFSLYAILRLASASSGCA
jgi:hypothetical protein